MLVRPNPVPWSASAEFQVAMAEIQRSRSSLWQGFIRGSIFSHYMPPLSSFNNVSLQQNSHANMCLDARLVNGNFPVLTHIAHHLEPSCCQCFHDYLMCRGGSSKTSTLQPWALSDNATIAVSRVRLHEYIHHQFHTRPQNSIDAQGTCVYQLAACKQAPGCLSGVTQKNEIFA